jgi:hypothetical protein
LESLDEHLQGDLWLESRDLVAGLENPQPAKVAHGLERALHLAIDRVVAHLFVLELLLTSILDGVGGGEAAEPVAYGICVAGVEEGGDAGLHDGGELFEDGAGGCVFC